MPNRRTRRTKGDYEDLGRQTFESVLAFLKDGGAVTDGLEKAVRRAVDPIKGELDELRSRLDVIEQGTGVHTRRKGRGRRANVEHTRRRRLPKTQVVQMALGAAEELKTEGRTLTMAETARRAGLNYNQIVYAFGSKEAFLNRVREENDDADAAGRGTASAAQ